MQSFNDSGEAIQFLMNTVAQLSDRVFKLEFQASAAISALHILRTTMGHVHPFNEEMMKQFFIERAEGIEAVETDDHSGKAARDIVAGMFREIAQDGTPRPELRVIDGGKGEFS